MPNIEEQGMAQWWERSPPTNVRALASHQCGPGSNRSFDSICGLSLLLVLSLAPRGFSPGSLVFPSPQKPTFPNSNSTRNQVGEEPPCGCATSKSLFIYFLFISLQIMLLPILICCHLKKILWRLKTKIQVLCFHNIFSRFSDRPGIFRLKHIIKGSPSFRFETRRHAMST